MKTNGVFETQINLKKNQGIAWCEYQGISHKIYVKGYAFDSDLFLEKRDLALLFDNTVKNTSVAKQEVKLCDLLKRINGNFALVIKNEQWLFAAVDRIRSFPLFYGNLKGNFFLSDNAAWVKEQIGDKEPDPLSVKELMFTGYVTGKDTLFTNVKQIQAGQYLWFSNMPGQVGPKTQSYYEWIHGDYFDAAEKELCDEMDCMHMRVFKRLIDSTKGKTIVVPLSGGYDSRLVITMLKRLGRNNVACFSYGRQGNWESEISRKVAEKLGYPWHFVPYSFKSWRKWFRTPERLEYSNYAAELCSIPLSQDWPAVWMLKERGVIPVDAVFVPGHTGDFISGGHVPECWGTESNPSLDLLLNAIWETHYRLWKADIKLFKHLADKIKKQLYDDDFDSIDKIASAFEYQDWQEYHAKYIVNTNRTYEFWGYDWRTPLWDNESMEFWGRVMLKHRIKKKLYKIYLSAFFNKFEIDFRITKKLFERSFLRILSNPALGRYSISDYLRCRKMYNNFSPVSLWHSIKKTMDLRTLGCYIFLSELSDFSRD